VLPDEVISKKFKQKGWLLGRNRSYDVCPKCLGITQENALANVFKVTDASGPVAAPAEIVAQAEQERRETAAKTDAALDRFLAKPAQKAPGGCSFADRASDPMLSIIAHDMQECRAALELVVEGNMKRNELLDLQTKQHQRHLELLASHAVSHMDSFNRLLDGIERQNAKQEQMIRAIANIVPTLVRSSEGMTSTVREAMATMMETLVLKVPDPAPYEARAKATERAMEELLGIRQETEDIALMPAPVQTVEPVSTAPAEAPVAPKPWRMRASASVTSYPDGRKEGHYLTHISVDRKIWDEMGYTLEDRFDITGNSEWGVVIRRAKQGGVKPKRVGTKTVVFQTRHLGDLNYKRFHATIGFGEIRI
jgi:hypothetical protein